MSLQPYTYGSFNLNDGVNFIRQSVDFSTVEVQQATSPIGRFPGVKKTGELLGERVIVVQVLVKSNATPPTRADLETQIDKLQAAMSLRQQNLSLHALDGRYYIADCTKVAIQLAPGQVIAAIATLTFRCQQPYALAASALTYSSGIISPTLVSGSSYTWTSPNIVSAGTIYAPPQIVFTNHDSSIINEVNFIQNADAQFLDVGANLGLISLAVNDTLTVQSDPAQPNGYTVLKNNAGAPLPYAGIFPTMRPTSGSWTIQINLASGTTPSFICVWTWTPRYLS